jgi:NADPH-dependent ferric siderophore reductase
MSVQARGHRTQLATRVRSVADVTDHMREIELLGPGLPRLRCRPGAHLVVRVPTADGYARRVYSVWAFDPQLARLVIRVAIHSGDAPGCVWARTVRAGDLVTVEPPRSKITIDPAAAFHVFAGDETGAVPLLAMRAALHRASGGQPPAPVFGVFETAGPGDEMPGADGVPGLPWVHRGRASAVASTVLLRAVQDLELPRGTGVAYVAGESGTCRLLQRHLVEQRGWARRAVLVQQQWAPRRPGFGAGVE